MIDGKGHLVLDNGAKIYWYRENSKNVGVALLVPFGSIHEEETNRGITHLLEHLLFKSNDRYSAKEMNRIVELSGAEWNASTYWDSLVIQMEFLAPNYRKMFELCESALLNEKFRDDEFEKEKEVVLTEIKEQDNDPLSKLYNLSRRAIYGDSDLGEPIGGYPETVGNLTKEQVEEHKSRIIKPDGIIMVLNGGVNDEIVERAIKTLLSLEEGKIVTKNPKKGVGSDIVLEMDTGDICYMAYGWELPELDIYRLTMLEFLMVVGTTSLLYERIREDLGLAYSFGSSSDMTRVTGYVSFGVEGYNCDKSDVIKDLILNTLDIVSENKIGKDLIQGKKNAIAFGKEKYRHFYAERAEDTARRINIGYPIESLEFADNLIKMNWEGVDRIIVRGHFTEIKPLNR